MKFIILGSLIFSVFSPYSFAQDLLPGQSAVLCGAGNTAIEAEGDLNYTLTQSGAAGISVNAINSSNAVVIYIKPPFAVSSPGFSVKDSSGIVEACVTVTKN